MRGITALFGTKQPMERAGNMVDGQDHTKHILSTDDSMMSSTQPAPCTLQECTTSIHDTVSIDNVIPARDGVAVLLCQTGLRDSTACFTIKRSSIFLSW